MTPRLADVLVSLYGAFVLARFDPRGMAFFDRTREGAIRSFSAAIIVAPLILVLRIVEFGHVPGLDVTRALIVDAIAYVIAWCAFPLVFYELSRTILNCRDRFFAVVVAYNWAAAFATLLLFPSDLALADNWLSDEGEALLATIILIVVLYYSLFVVKTAARLALSHAMAVIAIGVLVDLVISGVRISLIRAWALS